MVTRQERLGELGWDQRDVEAPAYDTGLSTCTGVSNLLLHHGRVLCYALHFPADFAQLLVSTNETHKLKNVLTHDKGTYAFLCSVTLLCTQCKQGCQGISLIGGLLTQLRGEPDNTVASRGSVPRARVRSVLKEIKSKTKKRN